VRLTPRPDQRRPDPPPLPTNDRRTVVVGTIVWGVLLVGAVAVHGRLQASGRGWWVWVPVAGVLLGLIGLRLVSRRRRGVRDGEPTP